MKTIMNEKGVVILYLMKMEKELEKETGIKKRCQGGLVDIEFIAQMLQMKSELSTSVPQTNSRSQMKNYQNWYSGWDIQVKTRKKTGKVF